MAGGLQPPDEEEDPAIKYASKGGIYFVLEDADLKVGKVGKEFRLLNSDEHAAYLKKKGLDPAVHRPDVCHQALLSILDSPLNKAGIVKGVFVHSKENVLIDVNPNVRLPRTFRRFCGLMVQLLQKLSIRSTNSTARLLKVVKGPVTRYLPTGAKRIALSHKATELKDLFTYVKELPQDSPVVFIVGAFATGKFVGFVLIYTEMVHCYSIFQFLTARWGEKLLARN